MEVQVLRLKIPASGKHGLESRCSVPEKLSRQYRHAGPRPKMASNATTFRCKFIHEHLKLWDPFACSLSLHEELLERGCFHYRLKETSQN